jgi:hypothetical protein
MHSMPVSLFAFVQLQDPTGQTNSFLHFWWV